MFRLTTTKTIGGEALDVPTVTADTERRAKQAFNYAIESAEQELNAPMMRHVGGRVELFLERCDGLFDGGDVLTWARVDRPLNSPQARTTIQDDGQ